MLEAASLNEEDPTPYALLQTVALGFSGREAGEEWLRKALELDPKNYGALSKHAYLLMRKWHGKTARESIDFARAFVTRKELDKSHPVQMLLIATLHRQYLDAAWPEADRKRMIQEQWVRNMTLGIFRNVYADNPNPPLCGLAQREMFDLMVKWLCCCIREGTLPASVMVAAIEISRREQVPSSVVPGGNHEIV